MEGIAFWGAVAAIVLTGIVLARKDDKKMRLAGRIILIVVTVIADAVCSLFAFVVILFAAYGVMYRTRGVAICLAISLIQIMAVLLILVIVGKIRKKKALLPMAVLIAVWCVLAGSYAAWINYDKSIPVVAESTTYSVFDEYAPYKENGLTAKLTHPASLKLDKEEYPSMDGATALFPVYSAFAEALYEKDVLIDENGNINKEVLDLTTTTTAYERIVNGEVDVIFVAEASEKQMEAAKEKGVTLEFTPIGSEAFVFFVNAKNPLDNITVEQVRGIYSGQITDWTELGVENMGQIRAFQRAQGSGSQTALLRVMGDTPVMEPTEKEDEVDMMGGLVTQVSDYKNYKNSIGYSFRFYLSNMVDNSGIKILSLEGIEPTEENIANSTYPVAGNFYAVTRSDADKATKDLLEWITGPEGQELVEKTGYTPLK